MNKNVLIAGNIKFLEKLYETYINKPETIDKSFHQLFKSFDKITKEETQDIKLNLQQKITNAIYQYRKHGHLITKLNPILDKETNKKKDLGLEEEQLGFTTQELKTSTNNENIINIQNSTNVKTIINTINKIYSDKIGVEFEHINNLEEKKWLYKNFEDLQINHKLTKEEEKNILKTLIKIEKFEDYLQTKLPSIKRFSIQGSETNLLALEEIIKYFTLNNIKEIHLGMSHRGRINCLANILKEPYEEIFTSLIPLHNNNNLQDVKYHMGYNTEYKYQNKKTIINLAFNPSHLESKTPVIMGKIKAAQDLLNDTNYKKIMGILIHGDAAFCGQGVLAESLSMSQLSKYNIGGIIHIIVNNQIGFTTDTKDYHTTRYPTQFAKITNMPIIHVNGHDIHSVIKATRLACEYKKTYNKDILIDIFCYRKYGHNEGDEPVFTQPKMYHEIQNKKSLEEIYYQKLLEKQIISSTQYNEIRNLYKNQLDTAYNKAIANSQNKNIPANCRIIKNKETNNINTCISKNLSEKIIQKLYAIPKKFNLHPKLKSLFEKKQQNIKLNNKIDWSLAEQLAFGSILLDGINIRLAGQDSIRGTFSQRHSILYDQITNDQFIPLNNIDKKQGYFTPINTLLSEYAALGFEYGYSISNLNKLVIWEAQYGDFTNTAQVIIDQFISSGEKKWSQQTNLVLLLPHGYEGQGPEHSSARIERFLQLAAENNMIITIPSTASSYFHILRKQALQKQKKPLIIFTPKSLLRLKESFSDLKEISDQNEFLKTIDINNCPDANRIIFCTGKIYYDLIEKNTNNNIAIIRIEQVYPFPYEEIKNNIHKYQSVKEFIWAQEEPINMGCWQFVENKLLEIIKEISSNNTLQYIGRTQSSVTATGNHKQHQEEKNSYIRKSLKIEE